MSKSSKRKERLFPTEEEGEEDRRRSINVPLLDRQQSASLVNRVEGGKCHRRRKHSVISQGLGVFETVFFEEIEFRVLYLLLTQHYTYKKATLVCFSLLIKTSMMWPSQNFLLYNGTVIKIKVNEWINN